MEERTIAQFNKKGTIEDYFNENQMNKGENYATYIPKTEGFHFVEREVPGQGWKIHLSASDKEDYRNLIAVVCPELIQNNVAFKCLRPHSVAKTQYSKDGEFNNQFGKEITIYLSRHISWNNFSDEFFAKLAEPCDRIPRFDFHFEGRTSGRFGRLVNTEKAIITPNLEAIQDDREKGAFPDFVKERTLEEVLYFYDHVRSRYSETGDLREYYSSMAVGTRCTIKKDMIVITGEKWELQNLIADFDYEEHPGTATYMDEEKGVIFADNGESTIEICRDSFWGDHLEYQLFPAGAARYGV